MVHNWKRKLKSKGKWEKKWKKVKKTQRVFCLKLHSVQTAKVSEIKRRKFLPIVATGKLKKKKSPDTWKEVKNIKKWENCGNF